MTSAIIAFIPIPDDSLCFEKVYPKSELLEDLMEDVDVLYKFILIQYINTYVIVIYPTPQFIDH